MAFNSEEAGDRSMSMDKPLSAADKYIQIMKSLSDKHEKALGPYLKEGDDELKDEINCTVVTEYYNTKKGVNIKRILNPLKYAWELHEEYMKKMPTETKILFVGMNPSTQSQTGIPFYDKEAMIELFGSTRLEELKSTIPVKYSDTSKHTSESGNRFWEFMREKFGSTEEFYRHCFVINYCPLIFIKNSGNNEDINGFNGSKEELLHESLMHDCNESLQKLMESLIPDLLTETDTAERPLPKLQLIVGVGWLAYNRFFYSDMYKKISHILHRIDHPSPNGHITYEGWCAKVEDQLEGHSVWNSIMEGIKKEKEAKESLRRLSVADS